LEVVFAPDRGNRYYSRAFLFQNPMSKLSDLMASKIGSKIFTGVSLTVAASVIIAFSIPSYRQGEPGIAGKRPDNFAFTLNGRAAHLSDLRGKVVVLNFWASWCPPCVAEIGTLNALQNKISSQGGTVLGISVDEDQTAYEKFLAEHKVPFPNFRDPTKKISEGFGTVLYPETYIIGPDGRIERKISGQQDWDSPEIVSYIESLLPSGK
jgi:cytochrome c biogenesis protein CcmG/thiol:disulfide interchange protein DsbE